LQTRASADASPRFIKHGGAPSSAINGLWRVVFEFEDADVLNVQIIYHH
jgi:plasmid maintenance system killer protein